MRDAAEETESGLTFRLRTAGWMRVAFAVIGLVPLLAPYDLLIKPRWNGSLGIWMIIPLVISAGALSISAALLLAALRGASQRVRIDLAGRVVRLAWLAPFSRLDFRRYPFAAVRAVDAWRDVDSDGPDRYGLRIAFADGHAVRVGPTMSAATARRWLDRLERGGLPVGDATALKEAA